jgi:predicted aspartyl protease
MQLRVCTPEGLMRSICVAGALAFGSIMTGAGAHAACQLTILSEFNVTIDHARPLVDAVVNGRQTRLLVDLGSTKTMLSRRGAAMLGLTPHRMSNVTMYGVGGGEVPAETIVHELRFGNAVARDVDLMVSGEGLSAERYIGILGQDFLAQADIEFDFANGKMRVIKPAGCSGDQLVYWNKPYALAQLVPTPDPGEVKVYVSLNGRQAVAQLDTGAGVSVVDASMAGRAGVTPASDGVTKAPDLKGMTGKAVASSVAIFPTLGVGDEQVKNAALEIANLFRGDEATEIDSKIGHAAVDEPDMLLGLDFIQAHRIYVARGQGKMYFSYNGGPIFRRPEPPSEAAAAPTPGTPAPAKP